MIIGCASLTELSLSQSRLKWLLQLVNLLKNRNDSRRLICLLSATEETCPANTDGLTQEMMPPYSSAMFFLFSAHLFIVFFPALTSAAVTSWKLFELLKLKTEKLPEVTKHSPACLCANVGSSCLVTIGQGEGFKTSCFLLFVIVIIAAVNSLMEVLQFSVSVWRKVEELF